MTPQTQIALNIMYKRLDDLLNISTLLCEQNSPASKVELHVLRIGIIATLDLLDVCLEKEDCPY